MISIRLLDDLEEARELHTLAFPNDYWVGDDHVFWVARDLDVQGKVVGFCSAQLYYPKPNIVFLSRAAVIHEAQGRGIHRRMIDHRVLWAWGLGADAVTTYTTLQNYASMVNLLDAGFRFHKPSSPWVGKRVHYFKKDRTQHV